MNAKTCILAAALLFAVTGCGNDSPGGGPVEAPEIDRIIPRPDALLPGQEATLTSIVFGTPPEYTWSVSAGTLQEQGEPTVAWTAPTEPGPVTVVLSVENPAGTDIDSTTVQVGEASLAVVSDPPGADISINGTLTGFVTPHTFDALAPGAYTVNAFTQYWFYENPVRQVNLVHGDSVVVTFEVGAANSIDIDLGGTAPVVFDEIGGIAVLPSGLGVIYAARQGSTTGIHTSSLTAIAQVSGGRLLSGVRLDEPLALDADLNLFYVNAGDSLMRVPLQDTDGNGLAVLADTATFIRGDTYAPARASDDRIAFAQTPSAGVTEIPLFFGTLVDSVITDVQLATTTIGRLPSWQPDGDRIAYQRGDLVVTVTAGGGGPDTLATPDPAAAPAWGPNHIAYLSGPSGAPDAIRLGVRGLETGVEILDDLTEPRFLAWTPSRRVLVSYRAGGEGHIRQVFNLPIP